jgi:hypothetical protein
MIHNIQLLSGDRNTSHVCYLFFVILLFPGLIGKTDPLSVELCVTDPTCRGAADGSIRPDVQGGSPPFRYKWSNGSEEQRLYGIGAGTYSVTVSDCDGNEVTAKVTICEPESLTATISYSGNNCSAPVDITAIAEGGQPPYAFTWNNGIVQPVLSAPGPGTYMVTVTDSKGCQVTESTTYIGASDLEVAASLIQYECGDEFGTIGVVGLFGVPPYTFAWSNGDTSATATYLLPGGEYMVTVTDAVGCSVSRSFPLVDFDGLQFELDISEPDCAGEGPAIVVVKPPVDATAYDYSWSNGESGQSTVFPESGVYSVTVYDRQGCGGSATFQIRVPAPLQVQVTTVNDVCGTGAGSVAAKVNGGTAPYKYLWANGRKTAAISGLAAGTYAITVTDARGCEMRGQGIITGAGEPLTCSAEETSSMSGPNTADGEATVFALGGTPPYTYAWSNGQTDQLATGLSNDEYTVTVTDSNACTSSCSIKMTANLIGGSFTQRAPVDFILYPIPFKRSFFLVVPPHYQGENLELKLQTWSGQVLHTVEDIPASERVEIELPDLPGGMYLAYLKVGKERERIYRVVKN